MREDPRSYYERPVMAKRHHSSHPHDYSRTHEELHKSMMDGGHMPHHGGAHANLPQEVVMKDWENDHDYMGDHLDDGMSGIDRQMGEDAGKRNKHTAPKKV